MLSAELRDLAEECGVLPEHVDGRGEITRATPERLAGVLRALGVPLEGLGEAEARLALEEVRRRRFERLAEPCAAAFSEEGGALLLRVRAAWEGSYRVTLEASGGEDRVLEGELVSLPVEREVALGGEAWLERRLVLPGDLPIGYLRARVESGGKAADALILSAPARAHGAPGCHPPAWGVFAPVYALRSPDSHGAGDLGDLVSLSRWIASLGGSLVGTLPILAGTYEELFEESPYSPISRLFWNELYLDLGRLARELDCPRGRELLGSEALCREAEELRSLPLVDYRRKMRLSRQALDVFAGWAWESESLRAEMEAMLAARPALDDYAGFRAELEARRAAWQTWPAPLAGGDLSGGEGTEEVRRYHVFVQWALDRQLASLDADDAAGLYLDLPVGVNGSSYDVWRYRDCFAFGVDVGAPPDDLFNAGQNWALPPLHPERQREAGYSYLIECVRHHMRHADLLRIDHVMGLHRLYWIPGDAAADQGLYVRYPAEELYAILNLESARSGCAVAGEDLGTVPDYVRPEMARRGFHRLYVAQFTSDPPPAEAVASLGTHDTPTFASFLEEQGIPGEPQTLLREWTERLASSPAAIVLVTLEDLWLEALPQNVPGPSEGRPNWRRKMKLSLPEIVNHPGIRALLEEVARRRKAAAAAGE